MIELIYGAKGTGKTKKMIDGANNRAKAAKGNVVFMTDKDKYSLAIDNDVRFVVTGDYAVVGEAALLGFVKGMMAGNADICNIYIDGVARILNAEPAKMESFMKALEKISEANKVDFTLAVSVAELPSFMKRYI